MCSVISPVSCFTACLRLEDVTLFLWCLLSQEEFSQPQPGVRSDVGPTIEWCCRSHIFTGGAPLSGPRPGSPVSVAGAGPEREFLLHSILNSLASGDPSQNQPRAHRTYSGLRPSRSAYLF